MNISLRFRLLLVTMSIAGATLVGVGLFSRRLTIAQIEKRSAALPPSDLDLGAVAGRLTEQFKARGEWDESILQQSGRVSHGLLLVSPEGKILLAWPPEFRTARVEIGNGGSALHIEVDAGGNAQELSIRDVPHVGVTDGSGLVASLYLLPPPATNDAGAAEMRWSVTRPLALAVFFALAAALAATLALSRYILSPVAILTTAVGRIAGGDLQCRIPAGTGDEIGRLADSFNLMAAKLARNEELRRNMVNDISHELRTPLTRLRCQMESIEDGLAASTPLTMTLLKEDVGALQQLIDDLQDLALGDASQLRLALAKVNLEEVIRSAVAATGRQAAIEIASPLPLVLADGRRVRQILNNLLGNALRYTPDGGRITVVVKRLDSAVETRVTDSGPGIAAQNLRVIFDRFRRLDDARTQAAGGTGLGLAIVKQLVEAHGGTVYAVSPPGEGATFVFTLPCA